jgi:AcrR family transcriptional regulator
MPSTSTPKPAKIAASVEPDSSDRPLRKGQRTRRQILGHAAALASTEGLSHLTIGRLADASDLSKSGLFAHFRSKQELQLATVEYALDVFRNEVLLPAAAAPEGVARLWSLLDGWLDYCAREVFPGGCFFAATSTEFSNREGPVQEVIRQTMEDWRDYLAREASTAQKLGQIDQDDDPAELAFELYSSVLAANWSFQLSRDPRVFVWARRAMGRRLKAG